MSEGKLLHMVPGAGEGAPEIVRALRSAAEQAARPEIEGFLIVTREPGGSLRLWHQWPTKTELIGALRIIEQSVVNDCMG